MGANVGRYANRISKGVFNLKDGPHQLTIAAIQTTVALIP